MTYRWRSKVASLWCTLLLGVCFIDISAQTDTPDKKWNFLAEPYLMFPYMDGETGIGDNLILPVEANPGDIFSNLQIGAMLYLEAQTERWAVTSDLVYMNLDQELTPGIRINEGEVRVKQFIWEAAGLYRLNSFLEIGVGGRLNNVQTEVEGSINVFPGETEPISDKKEKTWYDPVLITRVSKEINDKWMLQFRGDFGGFGIGSDFTWQLQGYASYRFTQLFQLTAGYRFLSTDYSSGEAPKEFIFDINEFGPVIRLGFNF